MNDTPASDEIDLTELFSTLWNAKWLIFLVTAGAVFATAVLLSVSALQKNDTKYVQSYVDITGITDAQYPNGMSF
jgi:LPS O-antigen subunit length determinant protein (WzzB/FepE family)